ncbi:PREDICTED: proteasome assembly chaperone 1 isoform X1 [Chinchilla lanigera]|uniref:proteasome assembly chaperone 1 isoform X1 n=1 Tax=Chinchilla lanigera TaxID=34839 RepID=UPI00038E94B1|nr:PREDICTED: proteasome assembly chaperone 1 isoform X1 [Chinchilla lanigera]
MAATFFGEVVKAPCRAGAEDDEEEEEERRRETPEDREVRRQLARKSLATFHLGSQSAPWTRDTNLRSSCLSLPQCRDYSGTVPSERFLSSTPSGREVRLLRRQTKASLEVALLEKYSCSRFIIAVGNNAVAFLSSFVMNSGVWEEVGCAKLWNEWCRTTDAVHMSPTEAHCVFYHLKSNPSVFLCQCSCYVAEDQQYQWLEKVFGSCPKKNMQVTVLTCRHVTDYKTSESTGSLPSPFLKALKTQNFKDPVCCSLLEQPNIVHDLPAAVLSYCQVWQLPAVLYLCYTDVMKLDLLTAEAFKPVLSSRGLKGLAKNVPQSTEILRKLMTANEVQSNIYT